MDVWNDLWPLIRNKRIGFGPACVFAAIWEQLGGMPGEITVTTKELGSRLNRDRSTVLEHLKKLNQFYDLCDVRCRYSNGAIDLRVYQPAPRHAEAKPDPQRLLPAFVEFPVIIEPAAAPEYQQSAAVQGGGYQPASQEPQRSVSNGEYQRLAAIGTASREGRGENPTAENEPWGKPHAPAVAPCLGGVRGPEIITGSTLEIEARGKPHGGRGENPTQITHGFSAEKQGAGKTPRTTGGGRGENPTGQNQRGENPTAFLPGAYNRPPRAPASLKDSSIEESLLNGLNVSMTERLNVKGPGDEKAADDETAALAAIQASLDRQRAARAVTDSVPPKAAGDLPRAIEEAAAAFDPEQQKQRLVAELRSLVADPETNDWLFGYAADLLVVHGQDAGREDHAAIYRRMLRILGELREIRQIQTKRGETWGRRGAWFNLRVLAIARDHAIKLPCELKAERERARQRAAAP